MAGAVAVLDVGKSNVKLSACTADGAVIETCATPNPVRDRPPWRHHDLGALNLWVLDRLSDLCRRHGIGHFIASGHGSGGILVGDDPDAGPESAPDGTVLPMVDYEQPLPAGLADAYAPLSGGFFDRGSAIMMAATHTARQVFWAERDCPDAFARARWLLGVPQYWAWRLSGQAASEISILGAQSHLWNVPAQDWSPIVAARGWGRLMPPMRRAWEDLGPLRPELARRHGLPKGLRVHVGGHDSSINFYRYQAAGLSGITVASTGTWIVSMADRVALDRLEETRGMTCNADVTGAALGGALTMGGREYAAVAGDQRPDARVDRAVLAAIVAQRTLALPTFGGNDGQFPDSSGRGRIIGPPPRGPAERHALAVLYTALLTVACADTLDPQRALVLDGSFLRDPAFAAIVAALRPGRETLVNLDGYGIASGAALLCRHGGAPVPLHLSPASPAGLPDLTDYARRWRDLTKGSPQ